MRPGHYYRHYRGRRTKGKVALAVLLVLVILAALVVIRIQQNVVYDETGAPRLDVPWREEPAQDEVHLDLVIQDPEKRIEEIRGIVLPLEQMTADGAAAVLSGSDWNAVAVHLKDSDGTVWFETATAVAGSAAATEERSAVLKQLTETYHVIGQMNCFGDSIAADADAEAMGLMNTGGFLFYDGENRRWLDPAKPAARQYLCDLAVDAARLGVDEILLTGFGYPTEGLLEKIAYGETAKNLNLLSLLELAGPERILVRVPKIPDFNTDADMNRSLEKLRDAGIQFEMHIYPHGNHGLGLAEKFEDVSGWANLAADWVWRNI